MTKKVLVVEDNDLNLQLFCHMLDAHGYEAVALSDGRELLSQARIHQPDLVITDIQLPHVNGLDLIRALRRDPELAATPIMAITAYTGKCDEDRIRAAGADAYVTKPVGLARFIGKVERLTGQHAALELLA